MVSAALPRLAFRITPVPMASTPVTRKRGRPATGMDPVRTLRLPDELWQAVERLAKAQELSRSEVIRVAVADYLKRKRALP
ncbi:MAG: Ribbon-helix-helix protein copG family [Microvirga sp.]|nr:Ribbon-helix-helix protein copG family [Microvirga sp.]